MSFDTSQFFSFEETHDDEQNAHHHHECRARLVGGFEFHHLRANRSRHAEAEQEEILHRSRLHSVYLL